MDGDRDDALLARLGLASAPAPAEAGACATPGRRRAGLPGPVTARADLDASARALVGVLAEAGGAPRAPTGATEGVDLVTNDVLALRRDPRVVGAAVAALRRAGLGAGGSRLLGGDDPAHRALEAEAAAWTGAEAALLYPSGTAANHGLVAGLVDRSDLVVAECENHGSLVEAVRSARARTLPRPPRRPRRAQPRARDGRPSRAALRRARVAARHGRRRGRPARPRGGGPPARRPLVDEAHAVGLLGPRGAGLADPASVGDVLAARTLPCGKALAGAGGLVVASRAVVDLLVHRSRAFAFTTGLPPAVAAGTLAALRIARDEPARAARARAAARRVEARLRALHERRGGGRRVRPVDRRPRRPRARGRLRAARARGFAVRAVRPPTVPEGTARVRLSCHADLTERDLTRLEHALGAVVR